MLKKKIFKRRIYSATEFFHDIFTVLTSPALALSAMWGASLSAPFRQRLMLAVTAVNGCRYCTYLHTREALRVGLSQREINYFLSGHIENVPDNEAKAVLYAQYWADNNARPDFNVQANFIKTYGVKKSKVIEMALLLIRIGNLVGNSLDYFLFKISNGQWGVGK